MGRAKGKFTGSSFIVVAAADSSRGADLVGATLGVCLKAEPDRRSRHSGARVMFPRPTLSSGWQKEEQWTTF